MAAVGVSSSPERSIVVTTWRSAGENESNLGVDDMVQLSDAWWEKVLENFAIASGGTRRWQLLLDSEEYQPGTHEAPPKNLGTTVMEEPEYAWSHRRGRLKSPEDLTVSA